MFRLARALLPLVLVVGLLGCGSSTGPTPTTIQLAITADPPSEPVEEAVPVGSAVTLVVTSTVDGLLHVHGYEEVIELVAGGTTERTFDADLSGAFEVETHEPDAVWVKLVVS